MTKQWLDYSGMYCITNKLAISYEKLPYFFLAFSMNLTIKPQPTNQPIEMASLRPKAILIIMRHIRGQGCK